VRASSERNWEHADTNGPAGPALGLGYKWHIKQMVAHSRLVKRVNLVDNDTLFPFSNFVDRHAHTCITKAAHCIAYCQILWGPATVVLERQVIVNHIGLIYILLYFILI